MAGKAADMEALKHIALMGGTRGDILITSSILAKSLAVTQQGASKRIISLESNGWIRRKRSARSQYISITKQGKEALLREYASYQQIFSPVSLVEIEGDVVSGMGKGEHFVSMPGYREQFRELLGSNPYEGTLNINVSQFDTDKLSILRGRGGEVINGFTQDGKTYGAAACFKAEIRTRDSPGVECMLVLPFKSRHWDTIEMVSEHHLRRTLRIEDGERVQVFVHL